MRYGLHVALSAVNPQFYSGWEGWLSGPPVDAATYGGSWAARGPIQGAALLNEEATLEGHHAAVLELAGKAHPGDEVILHHSHHGGRQDWGILGGYHETFCLYDGELLDTEFRRLLGAFQPGVAVIVDIDACHADGMQRGFSRSKSRPRFITPRFVPGAAREDAAVRADVIIRGACRADEVCIETQRGETMRIHGAWTWSLCDSLITAKTVGQQYEQAASYAAREFPNQHPRMALLGTNPKRVLDLRISP